MTQVESPAQVLRGLGRAFAGAVLFALPIFMTMEVWFLSATIPRWRLGLLVVLTVVLAIGMARYVGFMGGQRTGVKDAVVDAGVALLAGVGAATLVLAVLAVVLPWEGWRFWVSVVALEALPATLGACFARSQLGSSSQPGEQETAYRREVFLMCAGATVLCANIAPTEEVVLIAARMTPLHGVALVVLELALMHAFVHGVGFKGGSPSRPGFISVFFRFTVIGYVVATAVSAYLLWTLGRYDGTGLLPALMQVVVLALPASLGAAAARLIV
ncbi:TIGR02587 family membrane protein [Paenibacillus sp. TRM 82003]|uniref:TIGR02587 family membrane protein n=1 Tax=Kineococcus sp. TRM81007 TaxID=2925831 RepID=UPI001F5893BA|nr:TIGR02587 family membrane protein [Kineococcus sp. TRM81007]MCI2240002.1 TIGR02587 family membrane protein [Kineococcus sp. TRM81007]MCI3925693.1 TIGR02587 family membrane protein [Paenibacillus sp. TRM 82003]